MHIARLPKPLGLGLSLAILATLGLACEPEALPRPRNVILISLDTLRADHLGAWGYARETSPRIDALAKESVVFRRAVAQAHATMASHASLFTSLYPSSILGRANGQGLSEWPDTLAEILAREGFATWGFVDGGNMRSVFGFDRGFEHYEDQMVGVAPLLRRAQAKIESSPSERFFLFLHCYDIHTPYRAPRNFVERFGDPDDPIQTTHAFFNRVERGEVELGPGDLEEIIARYDAGIRYTDEQIGTFLDWLELRGLLQDSLLVIVSDHGEEFFEHGRIGHHQLHLDPNLRVPLLFRIAGAEPRVVEQTVELADVVPTILELLGLPPGEHMVGRSLASVLAGARADDGRLAYAERGKKGVATIIADDYQLIEDTRSQEQRLFDLRREPASEIDLTSAEADTMRTLDRELTRRHALAAGLRRERPSEGPSNSSAELDETVRRELEALGYLEPGDAP